MRLGLLLAAGALALAAPACAADKASATGKASAGFAAAFGNTVKATYPDGRFQRYWFKPDGTWSAIGRRGKPSSGKWTQKGDRVCLKQTKPFSSPFKYCTDFSAAKGIGDSWPAKDAGGGRITLSLVKGGG
jgi:hypothetical protein